MSGKTDTAADADADPSIEGVEKSEDDKTVEELLADLGPTEQWDVSKSEYDQVEELLRSADVTLAKGPVLEKIPDDDNDKTKPAPAALPSVDITVFQPEPESEEEEDSQPQSKAATQHAIDSEAEDVLNRLLDELKLEKAQDAEEVDGNDEGEDPPPYEEHAEGSNQHKEDAAFNLPSAPSKLPDPGEAEDTNDTNDDDLAARFASLSLPSAPTTIQSKPQTYGKAGKGFTEEEIDSWCIICSDDATLSCIGCDGDLYCTNCWLEGHRGEDAGYEEKTHKAVQYVKGKKKRKAPQGRVMMGA